MSSNNQQTIIQAVRNITSAMMGGSSKSGGISKEGNPFQLLPGAKGIFNN
jgi:hypothetical protein